ncbi:ribonuclease H-like domain-containing protein [Tanacetum coccineum]
MITRSQTGSLRPMKRMNLSALTIHYPLPRTSKQAMCDPNWKQAMDSEMFALLSNDTWELVPRPTHANIVGLRWLYRYMFDSLGHLEQYKGRSVAQGLSQEPGIDFDETFSLVVKPATIRIFLSIDISRHWPIHQLDVKNAFLNGDLTEEVYMKQPPAPRAWYQRFAVYIFSLGFCSSKSDTSLFTYHRGRDTIYLLLYVDDIILATPSPDSVHRVLLCLSSEFSMTDLGILSYFLRISVVHCSKGLFISQYSFAIEILFHADMESCNP